MQIIFDTKNIPTMVEIGEALRDSEIGYGMVMQVTGCSHPTAREILAGKGIFEQRPFKWVISLIELLIQHSSQHPAIAHLAAVNEKPNE